MKPIQLMTYRSGSTLPTLPGKSLSCSSELFHVYARTPGYSPILVVASIDGKPVAKLLAVIRRSARLFPPSIIKRCELFGTGEYFDQTLPQDELFGEMLEHLTQEVKNECFLIEVRNLPTALFGHRHFRHNKYFSINWLRVYNSLHSLAPEKRLDSSRLREIRQAQKLGVTTQMAKTKEEIDSFLRLLQLNYSSKLRKHFPDLQLFRLLMQLNTDQETARIFIVKYKERIIGGSFCIYMEDRTHLAFSFGLQKTYRRLHPRTMAIWAAMTDAHQKGYQHFEFMDAGLPFKHTGYRHFLLSFGGKQISTRRWFRFGWEWLNRLAGWLYR